MSRKQKWKGVPLNHTNIDEYMKDLHNSTSGQYITQGVSFNKDDNFQMNLLKNALISHGSFSGFVKHILFTHFETHGKLADDIWLPNETTSETPSTPVKEDEGTTVVENQQKELIAEVEEVVEQEKPVNKVEEAPLPPAPTPVTEKKPPKAPRKPRGQRDLSQFIVPPKN